MSFLEKFFGGERSPSKELVHAVTVKIINEGLDGHALRPLDDEIRTAIRNAGVGEFDRHEFGPMVSFAGWPLKVQDGGVPFQATLYMHGPDANKLFDVILPVLKRCELCKGAKAILRYGEPGAPEKEVQI